jgi:CheY-like chemotaxis protein
VPNILIIEDDPGERSAVAEALEAAGHKCVSAASVREALRYLGTRVELRHTAPRAILLDLRLPDASGWKFLEAQAVRPELAQIPVYIVTGVDDVATEELTKCPAVRAIVKKPLDLASLLDMLEPYLPDPH